MGDDECGCTCKLLFVVIKNENYLLSLIYTRRKQRPFSV